jgi:hypothetical protein
VASASFPSTSSTSSTANASCVNVCLSSKSMYRTLKRLGHSGHK